MNMLRFFETKAFGGYKSKIFVIEYWIPGREDRVGEPGRRSMRLGDDFNWQGVSQEAILRIRRLWRIVCGAHGCSALQPLPRLIQNTFCKFDINYFWFRNLNSVTNLNLL